MNYTLKIKIADYVFQCIIEDFNLYKILRNKYRAFSDKRRADVVMHFSLKHDNRRYYKLKDDFKKHKIDFNVNSKDMCRIIHNNFYGFENFLSSVIYYWLLHKKVIVLHASGVIRNRKAYVFCGKPGAGKTTIAKLLGSQIMNDNEILIKKRNSKFVAYSSPFKRRGIKPKNINAPLAGIFFLKRRNFKKITKLGKDQAFKHIIINHYIPKFSYQYKNDVENLFKMCIGITGSAPCYELSFKLDKKIWRDINALTKLHNEKEGFSFSNS